MNALELSIINGIIADEIKSLYGKLKTANDESDITISYAETERIYDIFKDTDSLLKTMLRNTQVDNTNPSELPF